MRILLVNDYGTASGGAELQMLALRDGLRGRGHEVRLFSGDASPAPGFSPQADAVTAGRTDIAQVATQTLNLAARRDLAAEIAAHPPDVVHIRMFLWQLSPLILPVLRDLPVLFQAAVFKAICPNGLKLLPDGSICTRPAGLVCLKERCVAPATWASTMAQLAMVRRWRHHIDRTLTLSRRMSAMFEAAGWPDVGTLGNGIEIAPARPALTEPPTVAYAGRLSREKGVETLLDAFSHAARRVPDARLILAGTGPSEAALRLAAAPFGDRIRFLGHLPRPEMERAFSGVWVQAVPSLWHEPFGNVSTEAMARGTAVVASDVGGQSDIVVDGETGYLVPPGDVERLADRLSRLLGDRALAEAQGRAGRARARTTFSREVVLEALERHYVETIGLFAAKTRAASI